MNDAGSPLQDSFSDGLLEGPHYTRPEVLGGQGVPPVLMSGHHARIARWRREASLRVTAQRRPDLIERARRDGRLTAADEAFLRAVADEPGGARQPGSV
jgi:tRNA (guanine37-N1)-methyltransferase